MSGFFDRLLGRKKETSSASTAKERLQFILVHDRIDLPPERLKAMKEEILAVISKYVAVYSQGVEITLEQRDRKGSMLIAEIPFSKSIPPSSTDDEKISSKDKDEDIEKETSAKSEDDAEDEDKESMTKSEKKEDKKEDNEDQDTKDEKEK